MVGKIVKDRGDGTYDVQVQKVRVPPIDEIIRDDAENEKDSRRLNPADRDEDQEREFRTSMKERLAVERTLAEESIRQIAEAAARIEPDGETVHERVPAEMFIRQSARVTFPTQVRWEQPYISIESGSFGAVGFIVGYSPESGWAAFVQQMESERFTTFAGFLERPVGIFTTLDCVCPLND
jgi:hypothetical protein